MRISTSPAVPTKADRRPLFRARKASAAIDETRDAVITWVLRRTLIIPQIALAEPMPEGQLSLAGRRKDADNQDAECARVGFRRARLRRNRKCVLRLSCACLVAHGHLVWTFTGDSSARTHSTEVSIPLTGGVCSDQVTEGVARLSCYP